MQRQIVLVSGAPAAGKTTCARPLAALLSFPLLSKDDIKEAVWDALESPAGDLAWSRRVGGAAMEVLWALAAHFPCAVLEANFRPIRKEERRRLEALQATIVEVYCRCSADVVIRRYATRQRHLAHVLSAITHEDLAEFGPMGVGHLIEIDTEHTIDIVDVARRVRAALGSETV